MFSTIFCGKELEITSPGWAIQASGEARVRYGNTVVLATATVGKDVLADFMPLTVDYEERFYAAGKIGGSRFVRREGKPSQIAILNGRMIDRAIRPLFPSNFHREVQVVLTVLSFDKENDADFPAFLAAATALSISNIPWDGPVIGLRVGKVNGKFIINPTYSEREKSDFECMMGFLRGNGKILVNMLDGEGKEVSEEEFMGGMEFAEKSATELLDIVEKIKSETGKEKLTAEIPSFYSKIEELFDAEFASQAKIALFDHSNGKELREEQMEIVKDAFLKKAQEILSEEDAARVVILGSQCFEDKSSQILNDTVFYGGDRVDGRALDQIRPLYCEAGILPRIHGSALFGRGVTKVLANVTLGAPGDELMLDGMEEEGEQRFLHQYNFPPFCSGEVKPMRGPGRREIGHGALAEKALKQILPEKEKFPYTIRVVSEVLSSNGSTSQGAICSSSMALCDAGVPIKGQVAGIALGLVVGRTIEEFKILTDIQGPEDHFGNMDFKVAGTHRGVCAFQLDTKVKGITFDIVRETLFRGKQAREFILSEMTKAIAGPRESLSPYAPKILSFKINTDKIGLVIGPGGKTIQEIIRETGVKIDIEEDGTVFITGEDSASAEKAKTFVDNLTREVKVGEVFEGKIQRILDFGLIVELVANQAGMLHVSNIPFPKNKKPLTKSFSVGETISVRVEALGPNGKIDLTLSSVNSYEPKPSNGSQKPNNTFNGYNAPKR